MPIYLWELCLYSKRAQAYAPSKSSGLSSHRSYTVGQNCRCINIERKSKYSCRGGALSKFSSSFWTFGLYY